VTFRAPSFSCRQGALVAALALLLLLSWLAAGRPAQAAAGRAGPAASRILSLGPALTEMVYALGLGDRIVGRTSYCNYPSAALKLPDVGAVTGWNEERVLALRPDLILALEGDRAPVARLAALTGARLEVLPTRQVADIWTNLHAIGRLTGKAAAAQRLVAQLKAQVARRTRPQTGTKVFYMVWDEPLMTAGPASYLGDLITLAGGTNVVAASQGSYPTWSWEALLAADPAVILAPRDRGPAMKKLSERYPTLAAVKGRRLRTLPDDLISRPGPRVVQALDAVAAALRP